MIYFIPDWNEKTNFHEDKTFVLSNFFTKENYEHRIVLSNYFPFLRYKLNQNAYRYNRLIRVFDILQNIKLTKGHPLSLEDLPYYEQYDEINTGTSSLLLKEDKQLGTAFYNEYGFLYKVRLWEEDSPVIEEFYDDRGFLSSKHYFDVDNSIKRIEYFNEHSQKTLSQIGDRLILEETDSDFAKSIEEKEFLSVDEAIKKVLEGLIDASSEIDLSNESKKGTANTIITTTEEKIIQRTAELSKKHKVIRILTDYDEKLRDNIKNDCLLVDSEYEMKQLSKMFEKSEITEEAENTRNKEFQRISNEDEKLESQITRIPIFLPKLDLGRSNTMSQMKLFLKLSDFTGESKQIFKDIVTLLFEKSQLTLDCEIDSYEALDLAKSYQKELIDSYFNISSDSEDFRKVEKYFRAKKQKTLFIQDEEAVKELQESANWQKYLAAVDVKSRINYLFQADLLTVDEKFKEARLYIDFEDEYRALRHVKAVSNGIPIITKHQADFVKQAENAIVIKDRRGLLSALKYFIDDLKNWNRALVRNVKIIEQHESAKIIKKWEGLFVGNSN